MIGVGYVFLACLLWAADSLIRYPLLMKGVPASGIVLWEHIFLVLLMSPILFKLFKKVWKSSVGDLFYFGIVGILGSAVATLAFTEAFGLINPSLVILLQKFQPIVAISLAHVFLKEKVGPKFLGWAIVCFLGGIMISYKDLAPVFQTDWTMETLSSAKSIRGYVLALIAVIGWGGATVFGKKLSLDKFDAKEIMGGRFFMGLVVLIPIYYFGAASSNSVTLNSDFMGKVFVMVLLSGLIGMFVYYKGLKILPARVCALAEMFFPFCAVAINWIFLGAQLSALQILGGSLLLLGSAIIQWKHY